MLPSLAAVFRLLAVVAIKFPPEKMVPKKNLFDKKRFPSRLILICQKHSSAGVGTFPRRGLPWFQRAGPSTTLDKNFIFNCKDCIIARKAEMSRTLSSQSSQRIVREIKGEAILTVSETT